jgi:hypothetical protein
MVLESWIPYLVSLATRAVNMVITSNSINSTTPWENFMGRKMNYQVDLRTFFGQYVQAQQLLIDNSMTARTSASIAMVSTGNERRTVIFFDLNSKKFMHRDRWTEVALTQEIIERVNSLAISEKIKPSTKLTVQQGVEPTELIASENEPSIQPLPLPSPPMMTPSEEGVEVMPGLPTSLSSDSDSDSDYFPSDVEDEEWTGDFEEDPAYLKDDSSPPPDQSNSLSPLNPPPNRYPSRTNRGVTP